ncbi:MAG: sulfurtransferase [Acidimicrobiales bacterium]|nr:sulfurtransferase [Acidimicrobiales bacterium]
MARRLVALVTSLALLATACGDDAGPEGQDATTTSTGSPTSTLEPTTTGATTSEVAPDPLVGLAWLDGGANDHVLIDTRTAAEFETGHIEGARNLSATALNRPGGDVPYQLGDADTVSAALGAAGITPDDTLVLYDADGSLYAARVYWALTYYGHDDLRILDGGLTVWAADGREIATGPADPIETTTYEITTERTELRLELPDVTEALAGGLVSFADARSPGEFDGSIELADQNGHLPGAANVDYLTTIGDDGRFRSEDELRAIYDAAGLGPDDPVVTYCLVGARAAHSWFVLSEILGYPSVALYDGSWQEYGNTPGVDVEG